MDVIWEDLELLSNLLLEMLEFWRIYFENFNCYMMSSFMMRV